MRRLLSNVPAPRGRRLSDLVDDFVVADSTRVTLLSIVSMFGTALGRSATVGDLPEVQRYLDDMPGATRTVKTTVRLFRRLARIAVADGLLGSMPSIKEPTRKYNGDPLNDLTAYCDCEISQFFEAEYIKCLSDLTTETVTDHRRAVRACLNAGVRTFEQLTPDNFERVASHRLFLFWASAFNAGKCPNWPCRSASALYEIAGKVGDHSKADRGLRAIEKFLGRPATFDDLNQETVERLPHNARLFARKVWRVAFDDGIVKTLPARAPLSAVRASPASDPWENLSTVITKAPPLVMDRIPESSKTHKIANYIVDHYFTSRPGIGAESCHQYRNAINVFEHYLNRPAVLADLNNQTVGSYLVALQQATDSAIATINKHRDHLLAIWRDAHSRGLLIAGPLVKPLAVPERIPTALTIEQLKQLRRAIPSITGDFNGVSKCDLLRAAFSIQYVTGARLGAVLALRFDDISGNVITLRAETRKGKREPIVKSVPEWVIKDINAIKKPMRERIFPIEKGVAKFSIIYAKLFELAEVPRPKGKSSHLLRSTHATMVNQAGGDATASLGHAREETTRKSYIDPRHNPDTTHLLLPVLKGGGSNGK